MTLELTGLKLSKSVNLGDNDAFELVMNFFFQLVDKIRSIKTLLNACVESDSFQAFILVFVFYFAKYIMQPVPTSNTKKHKLDDNNFSVVHVEPMDIDELTKKFNDLNCEYVQSKKKHNSKNT